MSDFFIRYLPEIFIFYGLSFLLLGMVVGILPSNDRVIPYSSKLWLLSLFGVVHGFQELIDGEIIHNASDTLVAASSISGASSFLFLLGFGRAIAQANPQWNTASNDWLYGLLIAGFALIAFSAQNFLIGLSVGSRVFFGIPGALLTGWSLLNYSSQMSSRSYDSNLQIWSKITAYSFFAYALFSPFIGKTDPGLPQWLPTTTDFLHLTDVPVQLFRSLCAFSGALAFTVIIKRTTSIIDEDLKKSLMEVTKRAERINQQQQAIMRVAKMEEIYQGELEAAAADITEIAATILELDRVSVWLLNKDQTELKCIDLYLLNTDRHSDGLSLTEKEFKLELIKLQDVLALAADEPLNDLYFKGGDDGYILRNRITAKLDCLIKAGSNPIGIMMFEHTHHKHHWEQDEVTFGCQLSDQMALTFLNAARKKTEFALSEATKDYLTGFNTRRQFVHLGEQEVYRAARYRHSLSMIILDIDHFKQVNDSHGHDGGDAVLSRLAEVTLQTLREADIVGRIGGEEFAILLPEIDLDSAVEVAERLRAALATTKVELTSGAAINFTVSLGVSSTSVNQETLEELMHLADQQLYKAKNLGRNRVSYSLARK